MARKRKDYNKNFFLFKSLLCRHNWNFGKKATFKDEWRSLLNHYVCSKCGKESWQSKHNDKLWSKVVFKEK